MAFYNYILLVILFLLISFMVISVKRKLIKKVWLRRTVHAIATITAVVITCTAVLFPNLISIPTTGDYAYTSLKL